MRARIGGGTVSDPDWLSWLREIQAVAQTGLAFTENPYDRERYEMLRHLAARIAASHTRAPLEIMERLFADQTGYATPKIDVRGAAFEEGRLLLVRETIDAGRWTLPGGWADVNLTPAENVIKEIREESGYDVRVRKLAAVWDRSRQGHTPEGFSCFKLFFVCDIVGGAPAHSLETSGVAWFAEDALPTDLSLSRVQPRQLERMFAHARDSALATDFE